MTGPRPNALVIGAARSGTTVLAESLRAHPGAFVTRPKEPHFLALGGRPVDFRGPGDAETINRDVVTDPSAYRALFAAAPPDAIARVEASVSTMYHPQRAIPAILDHATPDVRLVALLRDPVARAFSSWSYLRVRGFETAPSLAAAVAVEDERVEAGYHHLWHYTRMSRYAEQLAPFVDAFGDALLVVDHDRLDREPARVVARVAEHLGLDPDGMGPTEQRQNVSGDPRSHLVQRLLAAGVRSRLRPALRTLVPFTVRERIRSANLRPVEAGPDDAAAVHARIEDDLARLPALLPGFRAAWLPTGAAA